MQVFASLSRLNGSPEAVLWMVGALFSFALMAVGARELSADMHTWHILAIRSLVGLSALAIVWCVWRPKVRLSRAALPMHGIRNFFHLCGQFGWFLGLGLLPLAEVFAIEFTVPFWTAILAAILLNERITARKLLSIALGLIGVCVIVKPGTEVFQPAALWVLAAALGYAVSYIATKQLSATESPFSILIMMCLMQFPLAWLLGFTLVDKPWVWPNAVQWCWLLVVGITAMTAHYCLTRAMKVAQASVVVTLDFLRLPLISFVGAWLYGESLSVSLLVGALCMLMGNYILLRDKTSLVVRADRKV